MLNILIGGERSIANGDTSYFHFEYTNGICQKWTETHNGGTGSAIYEYNSKGLPVKVSFLQLGYLL